MINVIDNETHCFMDTANDENLTTIFMFRCQGKLGFQVIAMTLGIPILNLNQGLGCCTEMFMGKLW